MGLGRFVKSALAAIENETENRRLLADSNYTTLFEQKGGVETAANRRERDVWRLTQPLKPLRHDNRPHKLAVHQGVFIDPYLWEFTYAGRRRDGTARLGIELNPAPDLRQWHKAEYAGTTTNTDFENYNTVRMIKKYHGKRYGLAGVGTQCQSAADDFQSIATGGRSTLPPAPISRLPNIILEKLDSQPLRENIRQAKGIGHTYSRHWSTMDTDAMVRDAMLDMGNAAGRYY